MVKGLFIFLMVLLMKELGTKVNITGKEFI